MTKKLPFLFLVFSVLLNGQNFFPILGGQRVGTSVFTFLKIGVSGRAMGMGEAVVALNQDAGSLYYNPAAIAQLKNTELSATRISWPADINYDFFSTVKHIKGRHYMGVMAGILHMAPMMETTEYYPHGTGNYFTFQDQFFGLAYSVRMTDRFSFGITVKHVQEDLAGNTMRNILLDMGTFYWTGYKSLRFSAALTHFGNQTAPDGTYEKVVLDKDTGEETTLTSSFTNFSPPTMFQVGAAMDVFTNDLTVITASTQLNHPVDNTEYIATGVEVLVLDVLYLRAGYKSNKDEENLSLGVGLQITLGHMLLHVDYSYTNLIHLSDPVRLSIGVSF